MVFRRLVFVTSLLATAASFFTLGIIHAGRPVPAAAAIDATRLDEIRDELRREIEAMPAGTAGETDAPVLEGELSPAARAKMITEIKAEIQSEMGLLAPHLMRERRSTFVEA